MTGHGAGPGDEPLQADLVLEGGGVKGIALAGALEVLAERGYRVNRVAGSSAGAVVGSLVAADIPAAQIVRMMREVDYTRFRDGPWWTRTLFGKAIAVLLRNGIHPGTALREWLDMQLAAHGGPDWTGTFGDLPYGDPGREHAPEQRFRLVVTASDISGGRLRYLPWDLGDFGRAPESQSISGAVRASIAIPFFFRPVRWRNRQGTTSVLVDGGMLSNFPISVFDLPAGQRPRWPTFGIKLSARPESRGEVVNPVTGPLSFAVAIVRTLMGFFDRLHIESSDALARTIFIDTGFVGATDFDLSEADRERLYENGRRAALDFLDGSATRPAWDHEAYIARHRTAHRAARHGEAPRPRSPRHQAGREAP